MSLTGITRHPNLWYDDGTVILIVEKTGFRVYRGLLAQHSEVFHDMFSLPQPTTAVSDTLFEGCPVVRLTGDIAEEVAEVLKILHDGCRSFSAHSSDRIPFKTVAAVLRVGTKYQFDTLQKEALRRITICYPADLTALQGHAPSSVCGSISRMKTCGCPPAVPCPIIWDNLAPIALVHLCCSLKLTEVLPAALYKCASEQPVSALFAALVANDNSLYSLTTDELKECMETRDYLAEQTRIMYQSLLNGETATGCADVLRCGAKMKDMVIEYHKTSHMVDFGALRALKSWVTSSTLAYGGIFGIPKNSSNALCAICASHVLAAIEKRQKEVWQNLRAKFCAPTVLAGNLSSGQAKVRG